MDSSDPTQQRHPQRLQNTIRRLLLGREVQPTGGSSNSNTDISQPASGLEFEVAWSNLTSGTPTSSQGSLSNPGSYYAGSTEWLANQFMQQGIYSLPPPDLQSPPQNMAQSSSSTSSLSLGQDYQDSTNYNTQQPDSNLGPVRTSKRGAVTKGALSPRAIILRKSLAETLGVKPEQIVQVVESVKLEFHRVLLSSPLLYKDYRAADLHMASDAILKEIFGAQWFMLTSQPVPSNEIIPLARSQVVKLINSIKHNFKSLIRSHAHLMGININIDTSLPPSPDIIHHNSLIMQQILALLANFNFMHTDPFNNRDYLSPIIRTIIINYIWVPGEDHKPLGLEFPVSFAMVPKETIATVGAMIIKFLCEFFHLIVVGDVLPLGNTSYNMACESLQTLIDNKAQHPIEGPFFLLSLEELANTGRFEHQKALQTLFPVPYKPEQPTSTRTNF